VGLLIAILRIALPVAILFVIARFIWPRLRRYRQQRTDRIEVEATVIKSEPHRPPDIPHSSYTVSPENTAEPEPPTTKEF
jgi:hypothetical protein